MREDQRQLIIERNKADEANRLLNVQMVRWRHPHECPRPGLILTSLLSVFYLLSWQWQLIREPFAEAEVWQEQHYLLIHQT